MKAIVRDGDSHTHRHTHRTHRMNETDGKRNAFKSLKFILIFIESREKKTE